MNNIFKNKNNDEKTSKTLETEKKIVELAKDKDSSIAKDIRK